MAVEWLERDVARKRQVCGRGKTAVRRVRDVTVVCLEREQRVAAT